MRNLKKAEMRLQTNDYVLKTGLGGRGSQKLNAPYLFIFQLVTKKINGAFRKKHHKSTYEAP
jgi:hypothetical protein